ncbi:MAG: Pup--protein ligase [Rothia sp. (in: high G+C Gram-positive bacteria)]|uniref:Pup--protein ligase n=1 Tax=Rothia sp. (in: high G+C Gram-positive bacteria) TaxID=1885016 RepID=UPI0026DEE6C2|nr:Pup--protein ligase [Rothia sp. (in: high G+C Gram-positive bacteria)]MDO5750672.1 Pup--protein ligase [Rothia sp. (in: high G+C Gram-positive bacteria)]
MEQRIYGIESEYGLNFIPDSYGRLSIEEAAQALFKPVLDQWRSTNVFLPNGGRLYLDVGSHPEYATAECGSITELIAQERAGELLFARLARQAQQRLASEGTSGQLYLFKNNVDSAGNSYGSHENYLISRKLEFNALIAQLVPFLVTRQILVGAGKTHPQGGPVMTAGKVEGTGTTGVPSYSFSQRADHIWEAASTSTSRSRPLINTRDEPHADASRFRRMHVINGDSNMAEPTILLKIASTDVVLRMLEDHFPLTSLDLASVPNALRAISHDLSGRATFQTTDGTHYTALSVQRHYLDAARQYVQQHGAHHEHVDYALDLWQRTLDAIESGDYSSIDTEIDWAIKKKLLDSYIARARAKGEAADYSSPRIRQLDLAYHDIDPQRSIYYALVRRGAIKTILPADAAEAATEQPPATRAALRSRFIRAALAAGEQFTVDWVHLKLNLYPQHPVVCKDPFQTESAEVDQLISMLQGKEPAPATPPLI